MFDNLVDFNLVEQVLMKNSMLNYSRTFWDNIKNKKQDYVFQLYKSDTW